MPQGLQIWDADGVNVLDTNSGTVKILGKFGYSPDPVTISHPLLGTEESFQMYHPPVRGGETSQLKVVFSGTTATIYNTREINRTVVYVGVY